MSEETKALVEVNREFLPLGTESTNLMEWMKVLAEAPYYKKIGLPGMMAMVLTGRECGVGAMASLNGAFWDIQGRISMSAEQMRAKFRTSGHSLTIVTLTEKVCTLKGVRNDNKDTCEMTFTMEDAVRGGDATKDNWKKRPKDMLMASCSRKVIRFLAPELLAGTGIEEGEIVDITPIEATKPASLSKTAMKFIDAFDLVDLKSVASKFIDSIVANTNESRSVIIEQCSEDDRFEENLIKFEKKISPVVEKKAKVVVEEQK